MAIAPLPAAQAAGFIVGRGAKKTAPRPFARMDSKGAAFAAPWGFGGRPALFAPGPSGAPILCTSSKSQKKHGRAAKKTAALPVQRKEVRRRGEGVPFSPLALPGFSGFFVGCAVSLPVVPAASSVVRSARFAFAPWAGCALGVSFRPSSRALSGFVAVVRFSCPVAAGRFAASWGRRLPAACCGCVVRPVSGGFAVSVPVAPPPLPVGRGRGSRALAAAFAARCAPLLAVSCGV